MFEPNSPSSNKLLEELAAIEHTQWIEWSKNLAEKENLSPERLERWQKLWVPYEQLDEKDKENDRKWARKGMHVTVIVAQRVFEKWAKNLSKRLKKRV
jgi:predicted transcriptional regulator